MSINLSKWSIADLQTGLSSRSLTMVEIVRYYLSNIEASQNLNAYVEVYAEEALAQAVALDHKITHDPTSLGKLYGCVVSIKDLICYKDHKLSAASKILDGFVSQFSATAVEAMIEADAIIIGRTNCDEFGMGSANVNSYHGAVKNGFDTELVSGGSSGGAAVSVQMDTCTIALGTDTGGSIRQPAAFTGTIGYKPSYGSISRYGLVAYASSFDQAGLIAHHIEDIDRVMDVISVVDGYDTTMQTTTYKEKSIDTDSPLRIAVLRDAIESHGLDNQIRKDIEDTLAKWQSRGAEISYIDFDLMEYLVPCYYILTTAEASSNLNRYDGIRYGYRATDVQDLQDMYTRTRTEGFGAEVKKRIMLGTFVMSAAQFDAYYVKAQKVRQMIRARVTAVLTEYDVIALPTSPIYPWRESEQLSALSVYMADIYTVLANLTGTAALSLPIDKKTNNISSSIQLISSKQNEKKILDTISKYYS
jgi:aspartyl-tRNA(Asn)/glutamyl-tRNA(Gln) amidotransferase subunit A